MNRINEFDQAKVHSFEDKVYRKNKELVKEAMNKQEAEEKEKKKMITYERMNKPIPIVYSKKLMEKSSPITKKQINTFKEEVDTQNNDQRYFS